MTYRPLPVRLLVRASRVVDRVNSRQTRIVFLGLLAAAIAAPPAVSDPSIAAKQAEAEQVLGEIHGLDVQLEKAIEAYDLATQKLHKIQSNLRANLYELNVARANLRRSERIDEQRLVTLYTTGDSVSSLGVLLGAGNISDLVNRADTANLVAGQDAQVQGQIISFKRDVRRERVRLQHARAAQQQVVQQRAAARASIQSQLAERHRLVASIRQPDFHDAWV